MSDDDDLPPRSLPLLDTMGDDERRTVMRVVAALSPDIEKGSYAQIAVGLAYGVAISVALQRSGVVDPPDADGLLAAIDRAARGFLPPIEDDLTEYRAEFNERAAARLAASGRLN